MRRRLWGSGHDVIHAVAGSGLVLIVMRGFGGGMFFSDDPGAMRRRRFHPSGKDEGDGEREAKADHPLDHAAKMVSAADLSI